MEARSPLNPVPGGAAPRLAAGVDEAGRGSLAGPVAAAAVILDPKAPVLGLADSKKLSSGKREALSFLIKSQALAWGLGLVWQKRVDEANILQASFEAMAKAVSSMRIRPDLLLIDGPFRIPEPVMEAAGLKLMPQKAIVRGDQSEPAVSAASIIAKCFRDRLMTALARKWPQYGFERHKGYGTREHLRALKERGPCPLHRLTFKGARREEERFLL